ncbi:hypothetical protein QE152_g32651 [Popillia japonica]|uniref:Uncharacterized protein n=1 Tax=Popillia japonica TaxID=7064 RepID=A0AAW1IYU8_POPJA
MEATKHDFVKNRDETRMEATKQNEKVQKYNEKSYNKNRRPHKPLLPGEYVMIKRNVPKMDLSPKMSPKFAGPYQISKVLDKDRYCLTDIPGYQISQKPYSAILPLERIKRWVEIQEDDEESEDDGRAEDDDEPEDDRRVEDDEEPEDDGRAEDDDEPEDDRRVEDDEEPEDGGRAEDDESSSREGKAYSDVGTTSR